MNKFLKIYKWIIISVIMQVLLLIFIENFMLIAGDTTSSNYLDDDVYFESEKKVAIDRDATQIKLSYNGEFACYTKSNNVYIMDIKNRIIVEENLGKANTVTYYKWMDDRNTLIYGIRNDTGNEKYVQVLTYDYDNDKPNNLPKLIGLPSIGVIKQIEFSHYQNKVYVKIDTSNTRARIYSFDINKTYYLIQTVPIETRISVKPLEDILYINYDDIIYEYNGLTKKMSKITKSGKETIIGVDKNDVVYIKNIKSDKTSYYSINMDNDITNLQLYKDYKNVKFDDIYFSKEGKLYYIGEKNIYDMISGSDMEFYGEFVEMVDGFIITKYKKKLVYYKE